jgi:carboxyl-terminal processing protease
MSRLLTIVVAALLAAPLSAAQARPDGVGVEDLRAFADAWGYIKDHYVEAVDDRRLLEAAIRGMLAELDEHSAWLSADELRGVEEQATGRYGGLGVRISVSHDHLRVIAAMSESPAERAGLQPGDRIVAINRNPLTESNAHEAIEWLRGAPGSMIDLTLEREGEGDPLELSLTRELIRRSSVNLSLLDQGIAHLQILQFQQTTATELDQALSEALSKSDPLNGLILDLRNNPGGMLQAAVAVSDRFLSDKLVVYADGRGKSEALRFTSNPGETVPGVPVVVLVNRASASAAEIVAGALQDHERAIVLGEKTYGKGSVQTIWPLRNGAGMRLTTSLYYTPGGRLIQAEGIMPDVLSGSLANAAEAGREDFADPVLDEAMTLLQSAARLYRVSQKDP